MLFTTGQLHNMELQMHAADPSGGLGFSSSSSSSSSSRFDLDIQCDLAGCITLDLVRHNSASPLPLLSLPYPFLTPSALYLSYVLHLVPGAPQVG
jgi:hypothetical protein